MASPVSPMQLVAMGLGLPAGLGPRGLLDRVKRGVNGRGPDPDQRGRRPLILRGEAPRSNFEI